MRSGLSVDDGPVYRLALTEQPLLPGVFFTAGRASGKSGVLSFRSDAVVGSGMVVSDVPEGQFEGLSAAVSAQAAA